MRSATLPPDLAAVAREARHNGRAVAPPRTATILGLGHHLPPEVVPNGPIAERIGVDDAWIVKRTGIKSRRRALPDEHLTDYATFAGRRALTDAGVDPRDIDLVLVATMTPDDITPNAAPVVAEALGAETAGAIDIGAACTGWLAALRLAAGQVETGRAERVLVIGAELLTRITNFDDPKTAMLFGDGAGAVLVGCDGDGDIGPIVLSADGSLADRITASHDKRVLEMDGHSTYQVAVKRLSEATVAAVARTGLELDDIDLFVYHQANGRILSAVGERLGLSAERVVDCIAEYGNTSAATLPLALAYSEREGRLQTGDRVLLGAFGAGFTWGATVVEWGVR
jgi:3-oxoacyl-[acyl-carrier-protein] synthase III